MLRRLLFAVCATASLAGCGDAERNEAKLFLDRVDPIEGDSRTPPPEAVASLGRLAFDSRRVREVRDACVTMYEAVIEAERLTREARPRVEALERLLAGGRDAGPIDPAEPRAIDVMIAGSNAALGRAREARPRCQDGIASLRADYGRRR